MKRIVYTSIILFTIFLVGCAYFNTFYNAKRYYKKAYHETEKNRTGKPTSAEKTNYQKAIEKALKLIEFYPKSKYVDDALLLMGKSFYHQQEYLKAQRQFVELKTNYPQSELSVETDLWLAKTELALKQFDDAEVRFNKLLGQKIPDRFRGEVYYYLGKLRQEKQEFDSAVRAYQKAIEAGIGNLKAEAIFAIGVNYDSSGTYDKAAEYFQMVLKSHPMPELRFEAEFRYARMEKRQNRLDEAIVLFEKLLGDERNKKWAPDLELEIADCLVLRGDIDGAIIAYQDITQDHKKSKHSAEAFFVLGKLHEEDRGDYDRALEQFGQVKKEFSRSEYADSAVVRRRDIQRLQALKQIIRMAQMGEEGELRLLGEEVEEDSLSADQVYAVMDSTSGDSARYELLSELAGKDFVDSVMDERYSLDDEEGRGARSRRLRREDETFVDWGRWIRDGEMPSYADFEQELRKLREHLKKSRPKITENPELKTFRVEELDKNLFLLAELYLFRFSLPDSAVNQYRRLVTEFPQSPYAPQALYNLGYVENEVYGDSERANTHYRKLMEDYPRSSFSNAVREKFGLPRMDTKEDTVRNLFKEAEYILFEKHDPLAAFQKYRMILEEFPDSELAPKAAYTMGWICETELDSSHLAFVLYDSLTKHYPETSYAKTVKKKVEMVKTKEGLTEETQVETPIEGSREKEAQKDFPVDSSAVLKEKRRVLEDEQGTRASPVGGIRAIQSRFVIPDGVDSETLTGSVTVRAFVDAAGRVTKTEFVRSTGNSALDAAVVEAVRKTKFRPARRREKPVSSWVTLPIHLGKDDQMKIEE